MISRDIIETKRRVIAIRLFLCFRVLDTANERKPITHKTHVSHYKCCISSICMNAYSTTHSTAYSTHNPQNGKKESG